MASVPWFFFLLSLLALAVPVQSQEPGFISIDCGRSENSSYQDTYIGIIYESDAQFIETGENENVGSPDNDLRPCYRNLRSFPNGNRNCYNLSSVKKGNKYLIRTYFMYGNYDGKNNTPEFALYIGVNRWASITFSDFDAFYEEIITVAVKNFISVCLVDTGYGTPFIAALELRPLDHFMYPAANESQSLVLQHRFDIGRSTYGGDVRYPTDPFDLVWEEEYEKNADWSDLYTSENVTNKDGAIEPLSTVMATAVRPINHSAPLNYSWTPEDSSLQSLVYMHFAELQLLDTNMTREFTVCCGSHDSCYGIGREPFSPQYLVAGTIQITLASMSGQDDQYTCSLQMTPNSNLPPILNAYEVFSILPLSETPTRDQDVEAILDVKAAYEVKRNWMGDPCVQEIYKWEGLNCDYPPSQAPTIVSLNLSSFGLKGQIAASLANLKSIRSLDLSRNSLTGPVPNFLGDLPSLSLLNLSGNQLDGSVPSNLLEKSRKGSLKLSVDDNPNLCLSGPCDGGHSNKRKIPILVGASVVSVVILLLIMLIILWKFKWRKQVPVAKADEAGGSLCSENRRFTFVEVVSMTKNFERPIGKGGFGTVYHGQMTDGTQVAVKMLSQQSVKLLSHACQGSDEFENEVQLLMRIHHKNLVPFIGYCQEGDNTALIYEYMAHGNLESHILGTNSSSTSLNWVGRLSIALDVAQGLEYLHNGCKPSIIHRDMKATNILLNERLEAKIGDFGMSKVFLQEDERTHVSTVVKGTPGYLDPEYCNSNNLTQKSDVYSFGVVLLELITGQPAIIRSTGSEKRTLVDWASPIIAGGDIQAIVDPRLKGDYHANSLLKAAKIVLACIAPRSIERPTMTNVVAELKDCVGPMSGTGTNAETSSSLEIKQQVELMSGDSSQLLPR